MTWSLERDGSRLSVAALGGMVEVALRLPDGRTVAPLFRPAWADTADAPREPAMLGGLRGEFLCAPFGYPRDPATLAPAWQDGARSDGGDRPEWPHGYSANHPWRLVSQTPDHLAIAIDYPESEPIARVERWLELLPGEAGFAVRSTIHARRLCEVPVCLHAALALPARPGTVLLLPGPFRHGYTHPTVIEPGVSLTAVDARFSDLGAVPAAAGGTLAFDRLPLEPRAEEVLFLAGTQGRFDMLDTEAGLRTTLAWDADRLPHCLVWISNRGRTAAPWSGRNVCVGIEPCCAAMDLGAVSARSNPLRAEGFTTAAGIAPDSPWECMYRVTIAHDGTSNGRRLQSL